MRPLRKPAAVFERPLSSGIRQAGGALRRAVIRPLKDERGVTAIEYTMVAALIALAIVVFVTQIGGFVKTSFESVASSL